MLLCEAWQQGEAREAGRTAVHLGQGLLLTLPHEGVGQAYRGQCSRLHLVVPVYLSSSHLANLFTFLVYIVSQYLCIILALLVSR